MPEPINRILPVLLMLSCCACSLTARNEMYLDPVYVVYRISIANRKFPPTSYLTKINLWYDHNALWYLKNENTFMLKYHEPMLVITEKGLHINFDMLPASYLGSAGDIVLYFLPLEQGKLTVSGEILTKQREFHYGPRHRTITRPLPAASVSAASAFVAKGTTFPLLFDYVKKHDLLYTEEFLQGKQTRIDIPSQVAPDLAQQHLFAVLSARGFSQQHEISFDHGVGYAFIRFSSSYPQAVEVRAAFEENPYDRTLHLFAYSIAGIEELFAEIESSYRELLAKSHR